MGLVNFLIKIGLDTTDVAVGSKRVESAFVGLSSRLKGEVQSALSSAFSVSSIIGFVKSIADAEDSVGDLAEQANETTDNIQRLQELSSRSGVEVDKYITALVKLGEARNKALSGDQKSQLLFSRFGVSAEDLKSGQTNLDLLLRVGQEYNQQKTSISAQTDAADLLGTRMVKVLNTINGIKEIGAISTFTQQDVENASRFNDSLTNISRNLKVLGKGIINDLSDDLEIFVNTKGPRAIARLLGLLGPLRPDFFTNLLDAKPVKKADDGIIGPSLPDQESAEQILARYKKQDEKMQALKEESAKYNVDAKRKRDLQRELDQSLSGSGSGFGVDSAVTRGAFFGGSDRQAQLGQGMNALKFRIEKLTEQIQEVNQKLEGN